MLYRSTAVAVASLCAAAGASAGFSTQNLFVTETSGDRVLLLDGFDGSVINDTFIDVRAAANSVGYTGGITPIEARMVGNQVWVSDQNADRIWRFNANGSFAGQIGVDGSGNGQLDNIAGFEVVGNTAYIAQAGNGAQPEGIVTVDTMSGNITGSFNPLSPNDSFFYDVHMFNNELLVSNVDGGNEAILRFALDGTFLGNFATSDGVTSFNFPQQINDRDSNSNVLVGGFFNPSGVFEFTSDGTPMGMISGTESSNVRGAIELGNGEILFTHGSTIDRTASGPVEVPDGDTRPSSTSSPPPASPPRAARPCWPASRARSSDGAADFPREVREIRTHHSRRPARGGGFFESRLNRVERLTESRSTLH